MGIVWYIQMLRTNRQKQQEYNQMTSMSPILILHIMMPKLEEVKGYHDSRLEHCRPLNDVHLTSA